MARKLVGMLVLCLLVMTACGADPAESVEPSEESSAGDSQPPAASSPPSDTPAASVPPSPSPTPIGEAELTISWVLPFTITAPADWGRGEAVTPTAVDVVDGTGLRVTLTAMLKSPDAPQAWVERLTTDAALDATAPESVEVGGASGQVFNARLSDSASGCAAGGAVVSGPCVVVHGPDSGYVWLIGDGRMARVWVLDVAGETVLLISDARTDRFESWQTTIDEVVSTLTWAAS